MSFCCKCGTQLVDGARFCPRCGASQAAAASTAAPTGAPNATPDQVDIAQNKNISILSYLGILVLVPLLSRKNSPFAQFHARQGLTLLCLNVVTLILNLLSSIFTVTKVEYLYGFYRHEYQVASPILTVLIAIVSVFTLVLAIIGIVNCCQGAKKKLPLLGEIDIIKLFTGK